MSELNNNGKRYRLVTVVDQVRGRQAHNLFDNQVTETVRPWFAGEDRESVSQALSALNEPTQRDNAAALLGLQIVAVS